MNELTHFAVSILLCLILGVIIVEYGGWIIMALVVALPLLDYLLGHSKRDP